MRSPDVRTTALDCLRRGLRSLRANPSFAVAAGLQQALALALTAAGFVPLANALGIPWYPPPRLPAPERLLDPEAVAAPLADLVLRWPDVAGDFALALLPATALWLLATVVFCWFQGGLYGCLEAADRRATEVNAPWPSFRVDTWRNFTAAGRRLAWPCFQLIHLYLLAVLVLLLVWALLLLAVSRLLGPGGELAAAAAGVGILLVAVAPLSALAFVSFWLAQADLPLPGATVRGSVGRSLAVMHRRPADLILLFAAYLAASLLLAGLASPLSRLAAGSTAAGLALLAAELAAAVALTTAFAAATVALMRDRTASEAAPP